MLCVTCASQKRLTIEPTPPIDRSARALTPRPPHQVGRLEVAAVEAELEAELSGWLTKLGDEFEPGAVLLEKHGLSHYVEARVPWGAAIHLAPLFRLHPRMVPQL